MSVTAYVLITTTSRETRNVLEGLKASAVVRLADAVTGPYDIIALVEAADIDSLGQMITQMIHSTEGVERTVTCITMKI